MIAPFVERSVARQFFIETRLRIDAPQRAAWDDALCQRLQNLISQQFAALLVARDRPAVISMYSPIRAEPELTPVCEWLLAHQAQLALPRVVARDQPLAFGLFDSNTVLRTESFGVRVPEPFMAVRPDLLVIPCVAFRPDGYRLGYGGGFYDRTLAELAVPAIGVAYDNSEWPELQVQPHDRRLDWIVTPTRTLSSGTGAAA